MATNDAPISIGSVTLIVKRLEKVADFYRDIIGLNELSRDNSTCTMGQGENSLLKLIEDPATRHYPGEAGLYHTAFLLPNRAALGSWCIHAKEKRVKLNGAADHAVSEALYLNDPEGNGVEVYVDRDRSEWTIDRDNIKMTTERLNLSALKAAAEDVWGGLPDDSVIGHVHLQVGNVAQADDFYQGKLGLDRTAGFDQASFYSSGGYHHHLAGNTWRSRGSQGRPSGATGLQEIELKVDDPEFRFTEIEDPWGIRLRFSAT